MDASDRNHENRGSREDFRQNNYEWPAGNRKRIDSKGNTNNWNKKWRKQKYHGNDILFIKTWRTYRCIATVAEFEFLFDLTMNMQINYWYLCFHEINASIFRANLHNIHNLPRIVSPFYSAFFRGFVRGG